MQEIAWNISILFMGLLVVVFAVVAAGSRVQAASGVLISAGGKLRTVLFWILIVALVPIAWLTLSDLPYPPPNGGTGQAKEIKAVGSQWSWELSDNKVAVGQAVNFHVTATDVNHGFAIYDSQYRLVAQTQSMPGYTNVLRHTFDEPGTDKILCLEYCGLGHHEMSAEINVVKR